MSKRDQRRIEKVISKWVKDVALQYQNKLRYANIRYTGDLEDLISYGSRGELTIKPTATEYAYEAFLVLAEEWEYVEEGRLAGTFPNVDALREYVRKKPVIPKPHIIPSGRQLIPTENQLAFLIGRKIKEDGIAPNPLLFETLEELKPELHGLLHNALSEEVMEEIKIMFKS